MKIVNKRPLLTADISSARASAGKEFWKMVLAALVLIVGLYAATGVVVDFVVARISFETEARIFAGFQPLEIPDSDATDPGKLRRARAVLDQLTADPTVAPLPYRLVVVDQEAPNAFAFPGGCIGISSGLLDLLDEEIEIAFVLGHELGHYVHRDHLQGLGRAAGFGILAGWVFGVGAGAESFGHLASFVLQRSYSQTRERQADRYGIERVYSAYGKLEGTDRLFRVLRDQRRVPEWAYMLATHPSPDRRIRDLERYARELAGGGQS